VPLPAPAIRLAGRSGGDLPRLAGLEGALPPETLARARAGAAALGGLVGLLIGLLAGRSGFVVLPVLVAGGFLGPERWLQARARTRRRAIVRELPDLLDLLSICVESGMALDPALRMAAARLPGTLSRELRATLGELALGTPRREAYRALAERCGAPEVGQVVAALLQAEELGAPLAGALEGQARSLRAARRQAARDRAAGAAPRIQLVVALIMVPGALLLVLGVLIIQLAEQVGGVVSAP
jgi:tight adherence protein C